MKRIPLPRVSPTIAQLIVDALDYLYEHIDDVFLPEYRDAARVDLERTVPVLAQQLKYFKNGAIATMKPIDAETEWAFEPDT